MLQKFPPLNQYLAAEFNDGWKVHKQPVKGRINRALGFQHVETVAAAGPEYPQGGFLQNLYRSMVMIDQPADQQHLRRGDQGQGQRGFP